PALGDLDLAWDLDTESGSALLRQHGVHIETTTANRERGTLAMKVGGTRVEITSFRNASGQERAGSLRQRILCDLGGRDMTVGALAWWLDGDEVLDPFDGLSDWRARRVVAVGDPAERVAEHPVRWLRYFRRAHQWGFTLDSRVRKLAVDRALLGRIPPE